MEPKSIKIDFTVLGDGYVLIYDEQKNKFIFVDPDEMLSRSVKDDFLPQDFIDKLDVDLDNRIDLDPGEFQS
jgi:hypothetical protein